MVRDVRDTIAHLLQEHCGSYLSIHCVSFVQMTLNKYVLDLPSIEEYMKSLETSRRYLLDIWS